MRAFLPLTELLLHGFITAVLPPRTAPQSEKKARAGVIISAGFHHFASTLVSIVLLEQLSDLPEIHRLHQMAVKTCLTRTAKILLLSVTGNGNQ